VSARRFIVGTRGSKLALRQTEIALQALDSANGGATFEQRIIQTEGDRSTASLSALGGRGVFVIEIEQALLRGDIDIAVHSLKDLPSTETDGLTIAAFLAREDARDALISREGARLNELPAGATIGTGSARRAAQVLALRPDVNVKDIRGNIDTRIRKVEKGEYDAIILAVAGLARLGWLDKASETFEPEEMLPSVGQGILAVQVRSDDPETLALTNLADEGSSHAAALAERAFERRLGAGCSAAIAAYATVGRGALRDRAPLRLRGLVGGEPGGSLLKGEMSGVAAEADMLGVRLAEYLIAQGAEELLGAAI
jgi:hydroxymethylbilane synthase